MQLYLYADDESIDVLGSGHAKALLFGSDFGYGNFGDVLQHQGAASCIKAASELAIASVLTLDAISRHADITALRKGYGVDALAFVSEWPVAPEVAAQLRVREVPALSNVSFIQLYGGGFLNEVWGDFVLGVAEYFLERLPGAAYVISGQQISHAFVQRVCEHAERFRPQLVGMRDQTSLDLVSANGLRADFSFDDAVEPLLKLQHKLALRIGEGVFVHLNSSDYTGNDAALAEIAVHLRLLAMRIDHQSRPVLFQAFRDAREMVVDSIETVKRLDAGFPFADVETVLLLNAILDEPADGKPRTLIGRFGYSSSYHVTLWLQLNGIPCWLRGSNPYYEQKRMALGVEGRFDDFLERMQCPDHSGNMQSRSEWLRRVQQVMDSIKPVTNRIEWELPGSAEPRRSFNYKGEPRFEQQLREAWQAEESRGHEISRLNAALEDLQSRLTDAEVRLHASQSEGDMLRARLDEHAAERSSLLSRIEAAAELRADLKSRLFGAEKQAVELRRLLTEQQQRAAEMEGALDEVRAKARAELQQATARVHELSGQLRACNEQLTTVGHDARYFRYECQRLHDAAAREHEMSLRLQEIMRSRSWRWTRWVRAGNRYVRTGRFDAAGRLGLFGAVQAVGRRLPIPQALRSALGRYLSRFRRR